MTGARSAPLAVGYVMTHYPRNAQTFIAGEIDSVTREGVDVMCFAMNRPDAVELAAPGGRERAAVTTYLKDAPWRGIGNTLTLGVRHPIGMARLLATAVASAGVNPGRMARRLAHLVQAARLARLAKARGLRHLHAQFGLAPATIAWFASRMLSWEQRVGFSFTIHGFHDFADPAETRLDLKASAATAVVCVSDFTRGQLFLQTPPGIWPRAHVIRCGIDLAAWRFAPQPRGDGPPTVIAIGRLSAEKGFTVLIDAMARLRDAGVAARLLLVGHGPERAAVEAAIEHHALGDRITLAGELAPDAVRARLREADIFCLPSFSEGLPVSIMEAMAAGVPVVTTWIAGIPELAENGVTALTVPPARADTLADALRSLIDDPDLCLRLAKAGRVRVEERHDQATNGGAMAALLRGASA